MKTKNNKIDVLNLEWASIGRDVDIVEPILSYLEIKYNLTIVRSSILNYQSKILKYNPLLIIIANSTGAKINHELVKFAKLLGIKVVSLTSEGDYARNDKGLIEEALWGWNKDKIIYEDLHLEWSEKVYKVISSYITSAQRNKIRISGAIGFDRFKFLPFLQRKEFLHKYSKNDFSKIIGIAGWGFDQLSGEYFEKNREAVIKRAGKEFINLHVESRKSLREIYYQIIKENPQVLFILKYHPGVNNEQLTEFYDLESFKNVIKIKSEENIADLINVVDFWMAYESTTCLEAWLLKKQTLLINPISPNFNRSEISKGSPILKTLEEVQDAIDNYYKNGNISGFSTLSLERKTIIKNIMEWDDGKNHIRAGEYIYEIYKSAEKEKIKINLFVLKKLLEGLIISVLLKLKITERIKFKNVFGNIRHFQEIFNFNQRIIIREKYKSYLEEFYNKNGMSVK